MKDLVLKVCVTGEGGTGKTTLLHRLISGEFIANMKMTIGTGLMTHNVLINGKEEDYNITYQLWDFAGEKRFRFFLPNYLKGSSAVFMCFDLSRYPTFKNLEEWYKIVTETSKPPLIYLIGNKKDLTARRSVTKDTVESWIEADDKQINRYFECSALSGENINEIFNVLGKDLTENRQKK